MTGAWLQLHITAPRDEADAVSEILEREGAVAVTLAGGATGASEAGDAGEEALLEPSPGSRPLWRALRIQALFPADVRIEAVRAALPAAAKLVDVEFLGADDWQERWRAHAVRRCFGGRLWLVPRDEVFSPPATPATPAVLRLDPGLAFGSGSHPTTRLCLEGLAALPLEGARVLDFGCGSGILALAASLLGAREVVAVDHDPQALLATRENAAYNSIEPERLRVAEPEAVADPTRAPAPFDLVVANILANPLVELAPLLVRLTASGGRLMLSGLLADQEPAIRAAYGAVEFEAPVREGEWIRMDGRLRAVGR